MLTYILIALTVAAIILFVLIINSRSAAIENSGSLPALSPKRKKPCPICGTMLEPGEKVTSHEYRGQASSIVHIFGCPHCYGEDASLNRVCPVCKKIMSADNYLTGTMVRGEKKIQLKIKGCADCASK